MKLCKKRGISAIGGLSTEILSDSEQYRNVQEQDVLEDKRHEAKLGYSSTWICDHNFATTTSFALNKKYEDEFIPENFSSTPDLILDGKGPRTISGLRNNIRLCLLFYSKWLNKQSNVVIDNRLEDLASFEVSRSQLWQWNRHKVVLENGQVVNDELVSTYLSKELTLCEKNMKLEANEIELMRKSEKALKSLLTTDTFISFLPNIKDKVNL